MADIFILQLILFPEDRDRAVLVAVLMVQVMAKSDLVEDPTRAAAIVALMIKMRLLCVNFVNVQGIQFIIAGIVLIGSMFLQAMVLVAHVNLVPVLKNQCHICCAFLWH